MSLYRNFIRDTFVPTKNCIHDCVDTGNTLVLSAGVETPLPIDCAQRNYKSTDTDLFFPDDSLVRDTIDDTEIRVKLKMTLYGNLNDICTIKCIVPHPTLGDILVDTQDIVLYKNNIDVHNTNFFMLYNGTDADTKTYGFKIILLTDANILLKDRSILVSV